MRQRTGDQSTRHGVRATDAENGRSTDSRSSLDESSAAARSRGLHTPLPSLSRQSSREPTGPRDIKRSSGTRLIAEQVPLARELAIARRVSCDVDHRPQAEPVRLRRSDLAARHMRLVITGLLCRRQSDGESGPLSATDATAKLRVCWIRCRSACRRAIVGHDTASDQRRVGLTRWRAPGRGNRPPKLAP